MKYFCTRQWKEFHFVSNFGLSSYKLAYNDYKITHYTIKHTKNTYLMKKIEAVIRKSKFEDVKQALLDAEIDWFSYWDITGLGKSTEEQVVRGQIFKSGYIQRRMVCIVVRDVNLEKTVKAILNAARTGEQGDGKIFVYDIEDTYRIRNGESGPEALYNKD
jgi:nitrogen regulatory protein P-II 1